MMNKIMMVLVAGLMASAVWAQTNNGQAPLQNQFVIYKWYEGKVANYAKAPPRGVKNYIMLNEYGMVITKDRPFSNGSTGNVIRAIRPEDADKVVNEAQKQESANPANKNSDGAISRAKLCDQQRQNLETLKNRTTVYEDNGGDNLVPLTDEQKQQRIDSIQQMLDTTCKQ